MNNNNDAPHAKSLLWKYMNTYVTIITRRSVTRIKAMRVANFNCSAIFVKYPP